MADEFFSPEELEYIEYQSEHCSFCGFSLEECQCIIPPIDRGFFDLKKPNV